MNIFARNPTTPNYPRTTHCLLMEKNFLETKCRNCPFKNTRVLMPSKVAVGRDSGDAIAKLNNECSKGYLGTWVQALQPDNPYQNRRNSGI